ncbi:MAG: hypothetical protein HQ457_03730 [Betaproteobacteria bacterium]|nr:hypothetical protein [Betaproteobacteria bacterium]
MSENHLGSIVAGGETEYKFKEQIALKIKGNRVILSGPTQLAIPQLLLRKGGSIIGYEFVICKRENHLIQFNNYDCDASEIPANFSFDIYTGSFNGINGQFKLQRRPNIPWDKIAITQDLAMTYKPTKPIF